MRVTGIRSVGVMAMLLCSLLAQLRAQQTRDLDRRLSVAIGNRDLIEAENALRQGVNVEARGTNGVTPLMAAAETGNVPVLTLLLENGADAQAKDNQGETALAHAARGMD